MHHEGHEETTANFEALGAEEVHVVFTFPVNDQIFLAVFVNGSIVKSVVYVTVAEKFRTMWDSGSENRPGGINFHPLVGII